MRGCDSTVGAQGRSRPVPKSLVTTPRRWRTWPTSCLLCAARAQDWCASCLCQLVLMPVPPTLLLRRHRPTRPQASRGAGLPPLGEMPVCPLFLAAGSFLLQHEGLGW